MGWFVPQVAGRRLQVCGRLVERRNGAEANGALLVLKLFAVGGQLRFRKCRRHFRAELVPRSDARGNCRHGAQNVSPGYVAAPGANALVGMGTAFAGIVRAPMTSVVMIFEIDAGLCGNRAANDLKPGELFHFLEVSSGSRFTSSGGAGWHSSAHMPETPSQDGRRQSSDR